MLEFSGDFNKMFIHIYIFYIWLEVVPLFRYIRDDMSPYIYIYIYIIVL